jgi:hypothetical protein
VDSSASSTSSSAGAVAAAGGDDDEHAAQWPAQQVKYKYRRHDDSREPGAEKRLNMRPVFVRLNELIRAEVPEKDLLPTTGEDKELCAKNRAHNQRLQLQCRRENEANCRAIQQDLLNNPAPQASRMMPYLFGDKRHGGLQISLAYILPFAYLACAVLSGWSWLVSDAQTKSHIDDGLARAILRTHIFCVLSSSCFPVCLSFQLVQPVRVSLLRA